MEEIEINVLLELLGIVNAQSSVWHIVAQWILVEWMNGLFFSGMYWWKFGYGEVSGGEQSQCKPARQRRLDTPSCSSVLWLSQHSRVSEPLCVWLCSIGRNSLHYSSILRNLIFINNYSLSLLQITKAECWIIFKT